MTNKFSIDLSAAIKDIKANSDLIVRRIVLEMANRIVMRSPVGNPDVWAVNSAAVSHNTSVAEYNLALRSDPENLTKNGRLKRGLKNNDKKKIHTPSGYVGGRFRANWTLGVGTIPKVTFDEVDSSEAASMGRIAAAIPEKAAGRIYFIVNNLPYARRLEYGWSKQAPAGMVGLAILEANQVIRQIVAATKK